MSNDLPQCLADEHRRRSRTHESDASPCAIGCACCVAPLRAALNEIRNRLVYLFGHTDGTFNPPALKEICEIAEAALAKQVRNSDVGAEEEQRARFLEFCNAHSCIEDCPLFMAANCENAWAQMPYGKGDSDGNPHKERQ